MEVKGTIVIKTSNGKSLKLSDGKFYTVDEKVIPYLAKVNKGDNVILDVTKKGTFNLVTKLSKEVKEVEEVPAEFVCEECGATLKDGKYKKCYTCNKKAPKIEKTQQSARKVEFGSPEDIAGKQRGCALQAAGSAIAGNLKDSDPETIAEALIIIAERALEWARAE